MWNIDEQSKPEEYEKMGIGGDSLREGNRKETPLGQAFNQQAKALEVLGMELEYLSERLGPISSNQETTSSDRGEDPSLPSSDVVRAMNENTSKINAIARRLRYMREMLEV